MKKSTLKRRSDAANKLYQKIDAIWESLEKIPSFTGKARFMDRVLRARMHAHNLNFNLKADLFESDSY